MPVSYNWTAFADSCDGKLGFTLERPKDIAFIGMTREQTSPIQSSNPEDYTWYQIGDLGVASPPANEQGISGRCGPIGRPGASIPHWLAIEGRRSVRDALVILLIALAHRVTRFNDPVRMR